MRFAFQSKVIHNLLLPSFSSTARISNHHPKPHRFRSPMAAAGDSSSDDSVNFGFNRPEMFSSSLSNTVESYDRHVFLCYKSYESWPSRIEDSDDDPLPKRLSAALNSRKVDIPQKTRLTMCSGGTGIDCSDGDVLIFPEMVKYRGLKESDVDAFVDNVLVKDELWASGEPESLAGAFVFVCCHANRDKRCGLCGPILIEKFKEEIGIRDLNEQVFVTACSHVGGHKYAGNVIIFGTNSDGKVIGDWYGYVTPDDVPNLLDVHINKGEIIEKLWRGQMGLKVDSEKGVEKTTPAVENVVKKTDKIQEDVATEVKQESSFSCCQGPNAVSCCRDGSSEVNGDATIETKSKSTPENNGCSLPIWMGKWEQSDLLMAAAAVGAVATVAVAYSVFKRST